MAGKAKPHGPSSERVAANLRKIRRSQGMSTAELSRRLTGLGQPIQDTGITKIEKGDRRVDVDDLVALAVALGCTPNALLMPPVTAPGAPAAGYELTPRAGEQPCQMFTPRVLWMWATGEAPLSAADVGEVFAFISENRPQHYRVGTLASQAGHQAYEKLAEDVKAAFKAGLGISDIRSLLEIAINEEVVHDGRPEALRQMMPRWDVRSWDEVDGGPADEGGSRDGSAR